MEINEWINTRLPLVVRQLENSVISDFSVMAEDGLDLAGRNDIYQVLDDMLAVLFPGYYSMEKVPSGEMNFFLGDLLRHISFRLYKHIRDAFKYRCLKDKCGNCVLGNAPDGKELVGPNCNAVVRQSRNDTGAFGPTSNY